MTIPEYLRVLRTRWTSLVAGVLVGLLGGAAAVALLPVQYTSELTLYVVSQNGDSANAAYQGGLLSQDRVKSYVELVDSLRVTRDVVRRMGLDRTPQDLADAIEVSSAADSALLDVSVTDRVPARAAAVADAVGVSFIGLADELERPAAPNVTQAVAVQVVHPATVPVTPSSPGPVVVVGLGVLGGLALGLVLAMTRHGLDTSVRSGVQLQETAGVSVLGTIPFERGVPKAPLITQQGPQSPRAEAYRQLRTNLQFVDIDQPNKVIGVTSSVAGEGKTTTVVNLAIALASAGHHVVLVEADLRRPRSADVLGVEGAVGLSNVLVGRIGAHEAVQPVLGGLFDVLTSGPLPPNPSELLASQRMAAVLDGLRARYDVVLVDTPPLLPVTDAAALAPATDGMILVCRAGRTSRAQVSAAVQALHAVSGPLFGAVLSMVSRRGPGSLGSYTGSYAGSCAATGAAAGAGADDGWGPAPEDGDEVRPAHDSPVDPKGATTAVPLVFLTATSARPAPSPRSRT